MKIITANASLIPQVRALFLEYAGSLDFDLAFQGFENEIKTLPAPYDVILLAQDGESWAGCVALNRWEDGIGEMKRLYVRPQFQGRGWGHRLSKEILRHAKNRGYNRVRLDTVPSMLTAIAMYRKMGFDVIPAYRENPVPGSIYFEKVL